MSGSISLNILLRSGYQGPTMELLSPMVVMSEGLGFNLCVAPFLNICVLNLSQRVESRRYQRWSELGWRYHTRVRRKETKVRSKWGQKLVRINNNIWTSIKYMKGLLFKRLYAAGLAWLGQGLGTKGTSVKQGKTGMGGRKLCERREDHSGMETDISETGNIGT